MSAPRKVLVVDYEPENVRSMTEMLEMAGFQVEVANDGLAAMEAFRTGHHDGVVLEAMIPKKHGFEVCKEIKSDPAGATTPVIITTGIYRGRKYRNQAIHTYHCDEYLERPFDRDTLLAVMKRLLPEDELPEEARDMGSADGSADGSAPDLAGTPGVSVATTAPAATSGAAPTDAGGATDGTSSQLPPPQLDGFADALDNALDDIFGKEAPVVVDAEMPDGPFGVPAADPAAGDDAREARVEPASTEETGSEEDAVLSSLDDEPIPLAEDETPPEPEESIPLSGDEPLATAADEPDVPADDTSAAAAPGKDEIDEDLDRAFAELTDDEGQDIPPAAQEQPQSFEESVFEGSADDSAEDGDALAALEAAAETLDPPADDDIEAVGTDAVDDAMQDAAVGDEPPAGMEQAEDEPPADDHELDASVSETIDEPGDDEVAMSGMAVPLPDEETTADLLGETRMLDVDAVREALAAGDWDGEPSDEPPLAESADEATASLVAATDAAVREAEAPALESTVMIDAGNLREELDAGAVPEAPDSAGSDAGAGHEAAAPAVEPPLDGVEDEQQAGEAVLADELTGQAPPTESVAERRPRRVPVGVGLAVIVAVVGAGLWFMFGRGDAGPDGAAAASLGLPSAPSSASAPAPAATPPIDAEATAGTTPNDTTATDGSEAPAGKPAAAKPSTKKPVADIRPPPQRAAATRPTATKPPATKPAKKPTTKITSASPAPAASGPAATPRPEKKPEPVTIARARTATSPAGTPSSPEAAKPATSGTDAAGRPGPTATDSGSPAGPEETAAASVDTEPLPLASDVSDQAPASEPMPVEDAGDTATGADASDIPTEVLNPETMQEEPPPEVTGSSHRDTIRLVPQRPVRTPSREAIPKPVSAPPEPPARGELVSLADVDVIPRVVTTVKPDYPRIAEMQKLEGRVIVNVLVGPDGTVQDAKVMTSAGKVLDRSALDAVRRWVYSPAKKAEIEVSTWKTEIINFTYKKK